MPKPRKPDAKAPPKSSPATSKPSWAVEIDPDLLAQLRKLPKPARHRVGKAIEAAQLAWGKPHLHSGAGIRRLADNLFESRVGLQSRLIFQNVDSCLYFHFLGSHDEVQRFLRSHS